MRSNNNKLIFFLLVCFLFIGSNELQVRDLKELNPPNPKKEAVKFESHGVIRVDDYYWMRDDTRKKPEVIDHLKLENKFLEQWFETGLDQRDQLLEEITSRIPKKEDSVPIPLGSYEYFRRYEPENEHAIYIRRKLNSKKEEIILDVNKLAGKSEFYNLSNWSISPSEDLMALAEDITGRRKYEVRIKNLNSGKFFNDSIKNTSGDMAWSLDGQYLFYVLRAPKTLLPFKVYRHKLGERQSEDHLVYQEKDTTFNVTLGNSRSMKYIEINVSSTTSSETLLIDSNFPESSPIKILAREEDHLYSIEDDSERLLILTNWKAKNFRLMETNLKNSSTKKNWKELVPHREDVLLQSFLAYPLNIVLLEREQGLRQIRIMDRKGQFIRKIKFNDPAYSTYFASNPEYESKKMYFGYTSMRTPDSIYSYNLATGRRKLLKQLEVLGTFSPSTYKVERKNIKVRDGTLVPVSLVYRRDKFKKGKNPLFVYGYGSYGYSVDPGFNSNRLSLLDRGFVFAIAHVRGGQELGRQWYEDGKMFNKLNTFYDFIDVTKGLIKQGYADTERVYAAGGSAGGLLIGAVLNMEPELYNGVIANVPFVDVITTMSDPSIPLTTGEYDEWGNPENKDEFEYIMQY